MIGKKMKFFIDTAEIDEIEDLARTNMVDGVTTNPSLIAKSGKDIKETISKICKLIPGPVSAEVTAITANEMVEEGKILHAIAPNVVVKIPLTWDGLEACNKFYNLKIPTNVTLCFSASQALLAAKAGATYISPFIGRLDDSGIDGVELIGQIRSIYDNYDNLNTQILAASVRHTMHVLDCAKVGADVMTGPLSAIVGLAKHPLTDSGLAKFLEDHKKGN